MRTSRKIAFSAVIAAIIAVAVSFSQFLPTSLMVIAVIAALLCVKKCGAVFGLLSLLAGTAVSMIFALLPAIMFLLIFATYALACISADAIRIPNKIIKTAVRYLIVLAVFNGAIIGSYFISSSFFINVDSIISTVGVFVLMLLLNIIFAGADFLIQRILPYIMKFFERI